MTSCDNPECTCFKDKIQKFRSWKCKLGFHDFHIKTHLWYECIRSNCFATDMGC